MEASESKISSENWELSDGYDNYILYECISLSSEFCEGFMLCFIATIQLYYVTFRDTVAELARYPPFKGVSTLMSKVPPKLHRI